MKGKLSLSFNVINKVSQQQAYFYDIDTQLPIYQFKDAIYAQIHENRAILIQAETGAGKSTLIGPLLLNYLYRFQQASVERSRILICEPRRVNCIMLSNYVQMATQPSIKTGYKVRFLDTCTADTQVAFYTTGMLLSILLSPGNNNQNYESSLEFLNSFDFIILDEIHENTMDMTFLHYILREMLAMTKSQFPKLVLMSATIQNQSQRLIDYYNRRLLIKTIHIPGQLFEVSVYEQKQEIYIHDRMQVGLNILLGLYYNMALHGNTTIVFLPGEQEIKQLEGKFNSIISTTSVSPAIVRECQNYIEKNMILTQQTEKFENTFTINQFHSYSVKTFKMYAQLPIRCQEAVLEQTSRKNNLSVVIFATNLLETSLTIQNCKTIIDLGLVKQMVFDNKNQINVLKTQQIDISSFLQRKGRAGRLSNGNMFLAYRSGQVNTTMETPIEVADIDEVDLRCKMAGKLITELKGTQNEEKVSIDLLYAPKGLDIASETPRWNITNAMLKSIEYEAATSGVELRYLKLVSGAESVEQLITLLKFILVISLGQIGHFDQDNNSYSPEQAQEQVYSDDFQKCVTVFDNYMKIPLKISNIQDSNHEYITLTLRKLFERLFNKFYQLVLSKGTSQKSECDSKQKESNSKQNYQTYKQIYDTYLLKNKDTLQSQEKQYISILKRYFSNNIAQYDISDQCYYLLEVSRQKAFQRKQGNQNNLKGKNQWLDTDNKLYIHPSSSLFGQKPACVLYMRLLRTQKTYMQYCVPIQAKTNQRSHQQ